MTKVFIDGSVGTTGLRINQRLSERKDIQLNILPDSLRKDPDARKEAINSADIVFLCLPDPAAIEAAQMLENPNTVVIDTSTAHSPDDMWTYGFPEIGGLLEKIKNSKRIANPGCHASGFISLVAPLTENGIIDANAHLTCFSLTGYSGGGKKMIADYENEESAEMLLAPRAYGLSQTHKHLPEMAKICGLNNKPHFAPIVSSYYAGMEVTVPLFADQIKGNIDDIKEIYKNYYKGDIVKYCECADENGFLSASAFSGFDDMQISVFGNSERITLVSRFDNLGKGASGSVIQNMNIVLGLDPSFGLNLGGK
ncbi:MAG: N-acetyl-gamma-glutamyl-phosphate reductase [Oscillospiraceae bacterium]|nr:N-acetyl-gamma-glutamyl-phosphate reductase [Candidatus Equicaccousia limihippi]